jgi:hypothetical protein
MTMVFDWRQLPFREIWVVDTEFYPGPGFANGGVAGDPVTPLCLVALEMRSGRLIRLWQGRLGPFPPYRLDNEALIVGYMPVRTTRSTKTWIVQPGFLFGVKRLSGVPAGVLRPMPPALRR